MRILVLDSGVERWNVTPSKSETTWSIETGAALYGLEISWCLMSDAWIVSAGLHTLRSAL